MAYSTLAGLLDGQIGEGKRYPTQEALRLVLDKRYGVDVSPQTMSAWCRGDREPGRGKLVAVLDALDVYGVDRETALSVYLAKDEKVGGTA